MRVHCDSDAPISMSVYRYRLIGTKIEISVTVIDDVVFECCEMTWNIGVGISAKYRSRYSSILIVLR